MKQPDLYRLSLYVGILLLLAGLLLRSVETFVLSAPATRILADWFGAEPGTTEGTLQRIVLSTSSPQKLITPPVWLGWAALSLGVVLVANGLLKRRK